jgi:hypothetical protein
VEEEGQIMGNRTKGGREKVTVLFDPKVVREVRLLKIDHGIELSEFVTEATREALERRRSQVQLAATGS